MYWKETWRAWLKAKVQETKGTEKQSSGGTLVHEVLRSGVDLFKRCGPKHGKTKHHRFAAQRNTGGRF